MDLLRDISMLMNMVVMMAVSAATFFSVLMLMMMNMVVMMAVSAATFFSVFMLMMMNMTTFFFVSVAFAGITSLINMFEAVCESWQTRFRIGRKPAVAVCAAVTLLVGLLIEEETKMGAWMDFITILVIPFGALLGAVLGHRAHHGANAAVLV